VNGIINQKKQTKFLIKFFQMLKKLNSYDHELSLRWALCARYNSSYLFLRKYIIALEFSGSGYIWIPYSIIMIALHYKSIREAIPFILLFTGLLFDIAIIGTAKGLTRRSRPSVNHDDVLSIGPDKYSFPSGHTSRAVYLLFYFIETSFFQSIPVPVIIIWLSSVVASRVLLGRHYISDVIAGIFFGIFECSVIVRISPFVTRLVFFIFGVPN
jgi:membrane-associated phospholipid phosphatase